METSTQGLGLRVWGVEFKGFGLMVQDLWLKDLALGFRVQGVRFRQFKVPGTC